MNKFIALCMTTILLLGCQDHTQPVNETQTNPDTASRSPYYAKYCDGNSPKEDIKTGADANKPIDQVKMGFISDTGTCGTQDLLVAEQWYEKSAKQDFAPAEMALGSFYASDEFYKQHGKYNIEKAVFWLEKAAASEGGKNDAAMLYLGTIYSDEQYGTKDLEKAKFWLTKSANKGNAEAKALLANLK